MADRKLIEFLEWLLEEHQRTGQTQFRRNEFIALLEDRYGLSFDKKIRPRLKYLDGKNIIEQSSTIGKVVLYNLDVERLKKELDKLHNEGESNDSQ